MNSNPFRLPADYPPPRQILREHFPNTANELLIKGGWGYEIEDATVVLEFDPEINPDHRFSGVSIENVFIQKRISDLTYCRYIRPHTCLDQGAVHRHLYLLII